MFVFLSKLLPQLIYPLGITGILLVLLWFVRSKGRIRNTLILLSIALVWIGGNRWISYSLARSLEWRYFPPTEIPNTGAIVILGGGTEPGLYPRPTVEVNAAGDRVLYGAYLYKQGKAPHILLSGGQITYLDEGSSTPAEDMAGLLREIGVPAEALWMQNDSANTHEDAVFSTKMLKEKGIKQIILVTSAMHMPRALALFQHQGLDVIPAPTDYTVTQKGWENLFQGNLASWAVNFFPASGNLNLTTNVIKEYIGLIVYRLQGWY